MNKKNSASMIQESLLWQQFQYKNNLSDRQLRQFQQYAQLLVEWNKRFNITTVVDRKEIIQTHFQDSICAVRYIDLEQVNGIADIGSGGGFPGIPIKIMCPSVFMVLIEVNQKKGIFLREVIRSLGLENIHVSGLDWRTFLRKADYPIDVFCARASLSTKELLRVFKSDSPYRDAQLIYWASRYYRIDKMHEGYVRCIESYVLDDNIQRRLVFFSNMRKK